MALTQVSTGGIKDGQVHTADLADAQITAGKLHADALDHTYTLGASGSDHYTFTGEGLTGAVNDPTLYLTRGKTYRFVNGNSSGAHPFRIQSVAGAGGSEYNTGVTNNAGAGGSTIIFEVPHDAPDVLYYICTSHAAMNGIFYVTGALADGTVTTAKLADDAVTDAKLANSINSAITANTAKNTNATHTGDVTGSGSLTIASNAVTTAKIADEAVTLAKLPHGDGSSNGKFLRANNGADPSFETVSIPAAVGGANGVDFNDDTKVRLGGSNQFELYYGSSKGEVRVTSGSLNLQSSGNITQKVNGTETAIACNANAAVELYYNGTKTVETTQYGSHFTGYKSQSSYVGFFARSDLSAAGFGTNHGTGVTTYDVDYYSPIPMFSSRSITNGASYLTFPSYAGGNYIKFTAPVAGLYMFELICSWETHAGGDWLALGWEKNTTTANGSNSLSGNGQYASGVFHRTSVDSGGPSNLSTVMWMDTNDYAVLYQQSCEAVRWGSNEAYVRGTLIS